MHRFVVSIVVPAFNEGRSIGRVIDETMQVMDDLQLPYEIIVVDDGSTDDTGRVASGLKATVLRNSVNRGKGYAMRKAFQHAQGDIIVTLDADGSHSPKEIPDIIRPLYNGMDVVAGSRFRGEAKKSTTWLNRIGNRFFNFTVMAMTRKTVTDSQTGFRAVKKEVLDKLNLKSNGFEIESEITVKSLKNGFHFVEKPITCKRRKYDISRLRILNDGAKIFATILRSNLAKIQH